MAVATGLEVLTSCACGHQDVFCSALIRPLYMSLHRSLHIMGHPALRASPAQGSAAQAAECLEKTAQTMRLLQREGGGVLVLLTGAVMAQLAAELLLLRCELPCRAARCRPRARVTEVRRPDPPRGALQAGRVPARARAEAGQRVPAVHRLRGARGRAGRLGCGGGGRALAVTGWAWAALPGVPAESGATGKFEFYFFSWLSTCMHGRLCAGHTLYHIIFVPRLLS
jgi:hypothetical protein